MDQILTYILSAVGILGFFLAGRKVWWAWYVNIANQVLWTVFSVTTQQWGFLLATGFYFVVFSHNAYKWTKDHFIISKNPIGFIEHVSEDERGVSVEGRLVGSSFEMAQQPVSLRIAPKVRPASDIPSPPGEHFKVDEETTASYMRSEGTDPAVSNDIAHVVSDVMRAQTGGYIHPTFTIRYGIAHEVQRRLDVKLKGTRPDEKVQILASIYQIDNATSQVMVRGNSSGIPTDIDRMMDALSFAKKTLQSILKGS